MTETGRPYFKKWLAGLQNGQFQSSGGPLALEVGSRFIEYQMGIQKE
ncbi:MAG: hypothetical protein LWX54_01145 [Deltaproteobacteria bacterium]|nr:hypothetical protein [Deltaproteobacteria bacterium]